MKYMNIRSIREDSEVTEYQMTELLSVSQNTYFRYETGKIECTASH